MNKNQRTRLEMIARKDLEPDNELEVLFLESIRKGAELCSPIELYTALADRFPEVKSDEIEAMLLGYDTGIVIGAEAQLMNEDAMNEAMREFNEQDDDGGFH